MNILFCLFCACTRARVWGSLNLVCSGQELMQLRPSQLGSQVSAEEMSESWPLAFTRLASLRCSARGTHQISGVWCHRLFGSFTDNINSGLQTRETKQTKVKQTPPSPAGDKCHLMGEPSTRTFHQICMSPRGKKSF